MYLFLKFHCFKYPLWHLYYIHPNPSLYSCVYNIQYHMASVCVYIFRCSPPKKKYIWVFLKMGIPQNGWVIMENRWMIWGYRGTIIFGNTHIQYLYLLSMADGPMDFFHFIPRELNGFQPSVYPMVAARSSQRFGHGLGPSNNGGHVQISIRPNQTNRSF